MRVLSAALLVCAAAAAPPALSGSGVMSALSDALHGAAALGAAQPREMLGRILQRLDVSVRAVWDAATPAEQELARARSTAPLAPRATPLPNPLPGPYYRFFPELLGNALPSGAPLSFASPCFAENTAVGGFSADGASYHINLTSSAPASASCSDMYWFASVDWFDFVLINGSSPVVSSAITLPVSTARAGASEWLARRGALVMRFLDADVLTVVWEVLATISLFIPALISSPIAPADAARTYDFLAGYANISMAPRPAATQNVSLDPALFGSGDLLLVHRPDGLGSLEQWGTGARTTHVVMFMRDAAGTLYVIESQSQGADWPIDRIQMNAWDSWQAMAAVASYGVVWLPMTAAARANFNETAAWVYINSTLGFNYGYQTFADTFFDTEFDNLPWPAKPIMLEAVLGVIDGLLSGINIEEGFPLVNILFTQTLMMHLGRADMLNATFTQALEAAAAANFTLGALLAVPESDATLYPEATGRGPRGPALVCDAYACAIHKAAGSLGAAGADINCAEQHNTNVYSLDIFDAAPARPAACIAADPDNAHCQLSGSHSFHLVGAGTVTPYAHMSERCPGLPVDYAHPAGC